MKTTLALYPNPPAYAVLAPNGQLLALHSLPMHRRQGGCYIKREISPEAVQRVLREWTDRPLFAVMPRIPDDPRQGKDYQLGRSLLNEGMLRGALACHSLTPTLITHECWRRFSPALGDTKPKDETALLLATVGHFYPFLKLTAGQRSEAYALLHARWGWLLQQDKLPRTPKDATISGMAPRDGTVEDWL